MIDIQLENKIIHALITVNRNSSEHSLSRALASLQQNNLEYEKDFLLNIDGIYPNFLTEKTNTAIKLGVNNPYERKTVMETLAFIDPALFAKDKGDYLLQLNTVLKRFGTKYQFSVGLLAQLPTFAQKAISIQTAIKNTKLLIKKNMTDIISPLSVKYKELSINALRSKVNEFEVAIQDITDNAIDPAGMYDIASKILKQNGYPEIAVKDKDPGALSNSIFYEMVAAKGVLKSLEDQEKTGQSSNVYDNIAVILIQLLK